MHHRLQIKMSTIWLRYNCFQRSITKDAKRKKNSNSSSTATSTCQTLTSRVNSQSSQLAKRIKSRRTCLRLRRRLRRRRILCSWKRRTSRQWTRRDWRFWTRARQLLRMILSFQSSLAWSSTSSKPIKIGTRACPPRQCSWLKSRSLTWFRTFWATRIRTRCPILISRRMKLIKFTRKWSVQPLLRRASLSHWSKTPASHAS